MSNVIGMNGLQPAAAMAPCNGVLEAIKKLQEEAEAGRIQHLAAVYTDGVQPPVVLYAGTGEVAHVFMLIGGIEACKATLLDGCLGRGDEYEQP